MSEPNIAALVDSRRRRAWPLAVLFLGLVSFPVEVNAQDVRSGPGCIYNCLNAKTWGWLAGKIPGMSQLSMYFGCQDCMTGIRDGKPLGVGEQSTQCIKCVNSLVTEIPGLGEILEAGKCAYDCRNCSAANPDQCSGKWSCVDGEVCWCSKSGSDVFSKASTWFEQYTKRETYLCKTCKDGQWGMIPEERLCWKGEVCHAVLHPVGKSPCHDKENKCPYKALPPM